MRRALLSPTLIMIALIGLSCSGAQPPDPEPTSAPPRQERTDEVDDGMSVEGLQGTLRRDEVDPVMNQATRRYQECFVEAFEDHPYISGSMSLRFTVAPDGTVRRVVILSANLGSRAVQDCILAASGRLRFPRPHGGEAEFDYGPLEMTSDDAPPFATWSASHVDEAISGAQSALDGCLGSQRGFRATLYIGDDGRARTLGVIPPSPEEDEAAQCLERALSDLQYPLPDGGYHLAKVTLEL